MDIKHLAYELYKIDWMRRISAKRQMDAMKSYYKSLTDETERSFNVYIEEMGFNGELYVSFDEFCDCEYLDSCYIGQLLNNDNLFAEYREDLNHTTLTEITETIGEWIDGCFCDEVPNKIVDLLINTYNIAVSELNKRQNVFYEVTT